MSEPTLEERKSLLNDYWEEDYFTEEEVEAYADLFVLQEHYAAMDQLDQQIEILLRSITNLQSKQTELEAMRAFHEQTVKELITIPKQLLLEDAIEAGVYAPIQKEE